jgi:hypothetical protein
MQDEKSKKVVTIYKISNELKRKSKNEAADKNMSVSELVTLKLEELIKDKSIGQIDRLIKGKGDLKPTSALLPEDVHKAAKHLSTDKDCSLADIIRYVLSK